MQPECQTRLQPVFQDWSTAFQGSTSDWLHTGAFMCNLLRSGQPLASQISQQMQRIDSMQLIQLWKPICFLKKHALHESALVPPSLNSAFRFLGRVHHVWS